MMQRAIEIKLQNGLEARPVAVLVQVASKYDSTIYIEVEGKKINAKSIMGILAFNPTDGMAIDIVAKGDDEQEAVNAIEKFLVCE